MERAYLKNLFEFLSGLEPNTEASPRCLLCTKMLQNHFTVANTTQTYYLR